MRKHLSRIVLCLLLVMSLAMVSWSMGGGDSPVEVEKPAPVVIEKPEIKLPISEEALNIPQFRWGPWPPYGSPNTYRERIMAKDWISLAGEPLSAMAGAKIFLKDGNAVDAACAILAATCVMNDSIHFGGENQALIFNPNDGVVYGINGCGVAPTGATAEYFAELGLEYPPAYGPLAALTPGIPGSLMVMLSEFGTLTLKDVLEPAIDLCDGYVMEPMTSAVYKGEAAMQEQWKYSKEVFFPIPEVGEIFSQNWLGNTMRKLVETEQNALKEGKSREEAIMAAYDRFYKGDIAEELVRSVQEGGGLITMEDMANWKHYIEKPGFENWPSYVPEISYKGIDVYKLGTWTQGPVLLQALNILEGVDLKSMGWNSAKYIHTVYQAMNLAYADRDFYYGDPYFPPEEPIRGLLSKDYAAQRRKLINYKQNDPNIGPGDPYPFQGGTNPFTNQLDEFMKNRSALLEKNALAGVEIKEQKHGTTSLQTADKEGWVVSCTPSGGWPPVYIAGETGVGMNTRIQQFVVHENMNPFNVVEPGKHPRVTLTPTMALKEGKPYLSWNVPGGDIQDQLILQWFLNVVEFGMDAQEAGEAPKFESFQLHGSFDDHPISPGSIRVDARISADVIEELREMGYQVKVETGMVRGELTGDMTSIIFDQENGTMMGGTSLPATTWGGSRWGMGW